VKKILHSDHFYIFVAVRMKSSRLSRKALADIYGKPLLQRLIENIEKSTLREQIVLCTSTNHQDDEIESFSMENGALLRLNE